jgi:hypothetical protein
MMDCVDGRLTSENDLDRETSSQYWHWSMIKSMYPRLNGDIVELLWASAGCRVRLMNDDASVAVASHAKMALRRRSFGCTRPAHIRWIPSVGFRIREKHSQCRVAMILWRREPIEPMEGLEWLMSPMSFSIVSSVN